MIARTPASIAAWGPSANGKKASEAITAPSSAISAAAALSTAIRTESTRLICPAPIPAVPRSRASTIAFERTCLHTFQANSSSPHSASVGLRSVTDLHLLARLEPDVAVLHEQPPAHALDVLLGDLRPPPLGVLEDPHVRLGLEHLERVLVVAGREHQLDEHRVQLLGQARARRAG